MSNVKYWVWLSSARGVGAATAARLLDRFGGPREVFFAAGTELEQAGLRRPELEELRARDLTRAEQILERCDREDIQIITLQDSLYPERLKNIDSPPPVLYVKGRLPVLDAEAAVAIVGSRNATPYGIVTAERFGAQIVEHGGAVISGMAKGVDAAGHRGALRAGGLTVAVLGSGPDVVYPAENARLYEDIAATGAVVSEFPPGSPPLPGNFPARNRIISGLSVAMVVIEAARHSGTHSTVNHALSQGREVFAVPGNVDAENSEGCNELIREGAAPATCGWDILCDFAPLFPDKLTARPRRRTPRISELPIPPQPESPAARTPARRRAANIDISALSADERSLYELLLAGEGLQADELIEATQIPAPRVLSALTMLEVEGAIRQDKNKRFSAWAEEN